MIELDSFYLAAGLLPPSEWGIQRLLNFRKEVFSKIKSFLENKEFIIPDFSRGTGKTTSFLIEAIHAEWHGYDTIIVYKSVIEQYYANHKYEEYKKKILRKFGPPLVSGKVTLVTKSLYKYYNNSQKIFWDTD
jgi:hypothetical protein